jgi:hypothetical protein
LKENIKEIQPWDQMNYISVWEINKNFRVKIVGAENIKLIEEQNIQLYVIAELYPDFFKKIYIFFFNLTLIMVENW